MLDALGLLTGARADSRVLQDPTRKCVVEAEFDTAGEWFDAFFAEAGVDAAPGSVVRREVSPRLSLLHILRCPHKERRCYPMWHVH